MGRQAVPIRDLCQVALLVAVACGGSPRQARDAYDEALYSLDRGDYARALDKAADAARLAPDSARFAVLHAGLLRQSGRVWEAERALDDAIARHPDDYGLRLEQGELFMMEGRADRAAEAFLRASAAEPDSGFPLVRLSRMWTGMGLLDSALGAAKAAWNAQPGSWIALETTVRALEACDRFAEADGLLDSALVHGGEAVGLAEEIWLARAERLAAGDRGSAIELARRVEALPPTAAEEERRTRIEAIVRDTSE